MAKLNKLLNGLKNVLTHDATQTIGGVGLSTAAGKALTDYEKANKFYNNKTTENIAELTNYGTSAVSGLLLGNPKLRKKLLVPAVTALFGVTGPKQIALRAIDSADNLSNSVKDYTSIQNDLADKTKNISQLQLDTAKANKEVAERSNQTSKDWLNLAKKSLLPITGITGLLAAVYLFNSLKNKKQDVNVNIDQKTDGRNKGALYLEIPSDKVSDKFYNQFSRELLFKDEKEKYNIIKNKELKGMNLTAKEKKLLQKFEKKASSYDLNPTSKLHDNSKTDMEIFDRDLANNLEKQIKLYDAETTRSKAQALSNRDIKFNNDIMNDSYDRLKKHITENPGTVEGRATMLSKYTPYKPNPYLSASEAYNKDKDYGLYRYVKHLDLDEKERSMLYEHLKDKHTPFWDKLLEKILPVALAMMNQQNFNK